MNSNDDHGEDGKDSDGDDPTKCLDWPCSNPHTPKTPSDEVLKLQSLVPKVHFHWAWPGMRKMRLTATATDGTLECVDCCRASQKPTFMVLEKPENTAMSDLLDILTNW